MEYLCPYRYYVVLSVSQMNSSGIYWSTCRYEPVASVSCRVLVLEVQLHKEYCLELQGKSKSTVNWLCCNYFWMHNVQCL